MFNNNTWLWIIVAFLICSGCFGNLFDQFTDCFNIGCGGNNSWLIIALIVGALYMCNGNKSLC